MKQGFFIFIFLLFATIARGQNSASLFRNYSEFSASNSRQLFFRLENVDFLKNNEYTGDIVTGYTLVGGWVRPKLVYYPSDKLRLEMGGHFLKYHGREEFENASFWFSTCYQPFKELSIIFGNLNNNENHYLIRPLFEPEQYFTEEPEGGIQFLFKNSWLNADLWLNWEQFIMQDDPFQEHFTFGWRSDLQLWSTRLSRIGMPIQFVATHKGGQIDASPQRVQTIMNSALGLSFSQDLASQAFKQCGVTAWYTIFRDASGTKQLAYDNGNGFLFDAFIDTRFGKISGNYWNAHQFIAPKGMALYQSTSTKIPGYFTSNREIVSLNYNFSKEVIKGASFCISAESYYDLGVKKLSYVWGFFFTFNESFFLKTL